MFVLCVWLGYIYMYTYRVAAMLNADGVGWGVSFVAQLQD